MATHRRNAAALRVRVEEARGLLPLSDEARESDSPLLVTLRLAPGETKHSARTRAVHRGLEPAWHEEIVVQPLPREARFVEFKVRREAEGLFSGRAFLGRVVVRIPPPGAPPERGWFELRAGEGGKHADELAARCRRAGRASGELGELRLSVESVLSDGDGRGDDGTEHDSPRMPRGNEFVARTPEASSTTEPPRRRAVAAATPPTPQSYDDAERHGLAARVTHAPLMALRHARELLTGGGGGEEEDVETESSSAALQRASASHRVREATHVHVAVVAARGLLPSDFPTPGEEGEMEGCAPSSDPYVSVRLLPALPEERHVTRVVPRTLDPLWEEELIFRRVHGCYGVEIKVWDYDPLTRDDYLGEVLLPLPDEAAAVLDTEAVVKSAASAADAAEAATEAEEEDVSPAAAALPPGERPAVAVVTAAGGPTQHAAVALAEVAATAQHAPVLSEGSRPSRSAGVVEGWFPLQTSRRYEGDVAAALRRAGRAKPGADAGVPAGALGEIFVRVTFGDGRPRPDAARAAALLRPAAHRVVAASLRVRIAAARNLPPPPRDDDAAADEGFAVAVRCERQRGTTPAVQPLRGGDVTWPADAATFTFRVTELTSDAVLALQLRRRGGHALVATLGEVPLPLPLLLAPDAAAAARVLRRGGGATVVAGPTWASVLPPRAPGEALFRSAAAVAGGPQIQYEAALTLHASPLRAYLEAEPLPPQPRAGPLDAARHELLSGPHPAAAAAHASARLANAMLAVLAAPMRTALYMQSWQEPVLNTALVPALAFAAHRRSAAVAAAAWPLWLALFLLLNGYVSHRIHAADAPPGERIAAHEASATSGSDAESVGATADGGPSMRAPGGRLPPLDPRERDAAAAHYAAHRAALARFACAADAAAAWLERCAGMLTWHDPMLSAIGACGLLACGVTVTALLALLRAARLFSSTGVVLCVAMYALVPMFAPLSRAALDAADLRLAEVSPVPLRSLCAGAGLRCTALHDSLPPEAPAGARRAAARARRDAAAQRDAARGRAATHGGAPPPQPPPPGTLRHLLLAAVPLLAMARAPDEPRAMHLRIARRAALLETAAEDDSGVAPL